MNFLKKKKAIIICVFLAIFFIASFVVLGFFYSNYSKYDLVILGPDIGNINYNTGTGTNWEPVTLMVEGFVSTTIDTPNLQSKIIKEIQNPTKKNDDGSIINDYKAETSKQIWEDATKTVIENLKKEFDSNENFLDEEFWNELNQNEKTILLLALKGGDNIKYDKSGVDLVIQILTHYRPVTYIGDNLNEKTDGSELSGKNVFSNDSLVYQKISNGGIVEIYTNPETNKFRLRLNDESKWDDGKRVRAEDYVFGISRQLSTVFSSNSSYMITDIPNIRGMDEAVSADLKKSSSDVERWDVNDYVSLSDKAIYNGLTKETRLLLKKDDSCKPLSSYNTSLEDKSGIHWYDIPDNEKATNENYSYVEFSIGNSLSEPLSLPTFITMLNSSGYLPIDADWYWSNPNLNNKNMYNFAINEDTVKSNGAYKITKFDSSYGIIFEKNNNYYDSDIVSNKKGNYRFIKEPISKIAMFENGSASHIITDTQVNKIVQSNHNVKKWIKTKFTGPSTSNVQFNLSKKRTTTYAKYFNDPNLRRAIFSLFDKGVYHNFTSQKTIQPTSIFSPKDMLEIDSGSTDFVDIAKETKFKTKYSNQNSELDSIILEQANEKDREDAMLGKTNVMKDENFSLEKSEFYWNQFKKDMQELGEEVPNEIVIKFLTQTGDDDPVYQTFKSGLEKARDAGLEIGNKISIELFITTKGSYFSHYIPGVDFDMATIKWSPDFLDIWAMLSTLNIHDPTRGMNSTTDWTFFDGSDYSFEDGTYGEGNDQKARELFNDGIIGYLEKDGGDSNISEINTSSSSATIGNIDNNFFKDIGEKLLNAAIQDNEIIYNEDWDGKNNRYELTNGINHDKHIDELFNISVNSRNAIGAYLLFETVLKDSASLLVTSNEKPSEDPSRLLLEGDPQIGFNRYQIAFDIEKIKHDSIWFSIKNDLNNMFYPK